MKKIVIGLIFVLVGSIHCMPQDKTPSMRVEIHTTKKNYTLAESTRIEFTAFLINTGNSSVYVAKDFLEALGGRAGFHIKLEQFSGRRRKFRNCEGFYDWAPSVDRRSPEQILKEDFVLLRPGGIVGFRSMYRGCAPEHPGTYQVIAEYVTQDWNPGNFPTNTKLGELLTGKIISQPYRFTVR